MEKFVFFVKSTQNMFKSHKQSPLNACEDAKKVNKKIFKMKRFNN